MHLARGLPNCTEPITSQWWVSVGPVEDQCSPHHSPLYTDWLGVKVVETEMEMKSKKKSPKPLINL